ncbi:MAG: ribbon-helix-helix protein, CopG family [Chloroflexi bacterium]|nr:ribbon-helix-helix protein, CopG family [Chloroflexota bacterium]
MKRTNIYLPESQLELLQRVSESRGRAVAELVREAVDSWLTAQGARAIPAPEWQARFDALMDRRRRIAKGKGWTEEQVLRDATEAIRDVRSERAARRP